MANISIVGPRRMNLTWSELFFVILINHLMAKVESRKLYHTMKLYQKDLIGSSSPAVHGVNLSEVRKSD